MATKITETIERDVYVWNCPECGKEMSSQIERFANQMCVNCTRKADAEKFSVYIKHLVGARIIDVGGEYVSCFAACEVNNIIVATPDGKQLVISGDEYVDGAQLEIEEVVYPIKVDRTIEEVLQNCAKLRGVHGLSWRTLHEFFWFVSMSKWGNRECYTEEEHEVYENFNGRPVGLNVSFDKMLLDEALLFEEYCENEYGAVRNTIEEYDAMFDAIEMIDPDIRKQVKAYHTATKLIKSIDKVLEKLGDE